MTQSLEKDFAKAANLPDAVQEQLGRQLLEDISGEMKWGRTLARNQKKLEALAQKARKTRQSGKTHTKGFDQL